jgi:uncharacterized protein
MRILHDIIDSIKDDAPVKEVIRGTHWTAVISKHCGLASTLSGADCTDRSSEDILPFLHNGRSARELAKFSFSEQISEASLGLAAINSLIEIDESRCSEINGADLLTEMGRGKNISIIGHFPFVDRLKKSAKNLWVIEKRLRPGDYAEEEAETLFLQSDIVAISSTTLINHTLEPLLALCPERSVKMLLGPTTPMSDVLFDYGIDIVSGSRVIDEKTALRSISEGANFRELKRTGSIRLVNMVKNISLFKEVVEI